MMTNLYCPLNISVLLHFHISPEPWPGPGDVTNIINEFIEIGALEARKLDPLRIISGPIYATTAMGRAWVRALCNVPPPRMVFVDEMDRIL